MANQVTTPPNPQNTGGKGIKTALTGGLVALLFLAMGIGAGYMLFNSPEAAPAPEEKEDKLEKLQASSLVYEVSIIVGGEVKSIQDNSITVENSGETITVPLAEEPIIGRQINPVTEDPDAIIFPEYQQISLNELQTGEAVSIFAVIKSDGSYEGRSVTALESLDLLRESQ